MYALPKISEPIEFPYYFKTSPEGLLAIYGNLNPQTLINAYSMGIFPWYSEGDPLLWWHPEPRMVLIPDRFKASKNLLRLIKKTKFINKYQDIGYSNLADGGASSHAKNTADGGAHLPLYTITLDQNFSAVMKECAGKRTPKRDGTWISPEIVESYTKLHAQGYAHSVEVWNPEKKLVGGLYGMALGRIFFGESMFSNETDTSKLALYWLCTFLKHHDYQLIDCQVETAHLKSLGAVNISRAEFLNFLKRGGAMEKIKPAGF